MEKDNVQKFIELYNVLDDTLRDKYHEGSRSFSMINRYINQLEQSSSLSKTKKARKLNMIRILRNNLVHEFDLNNENLFNISSDTIKFLEDEIEDLKDPITAFKICTKFENLYTVDKSTRPMEAMKYMSSHGFTQVPIVENNLLIGVFTPNVLFAYFVKNEIHKNYKLTIQDFMEFAPIKKHISEKYAFVEKDATMDEVMELFDASHRENKKLAAIFVTETGKENERLLGMIVPYDLLNSKKLRK